MQSDVRYRTQQHLSVQFAARLFLRDVLER
jgi:hypothetical protein